MSQIKLKCGSIYQVNKIRAIRINNDGILEVEIQEKPRGKYKNTLFSLKSIEYTDIKKIDDLLPRCNHTENFGNTLDLISCNHYLYATVNHWKCKICDIRIIEQIGARDDTSYYYFGLSDGYNLDLESLKN